MTVCQTQRPIQCNGCYENHGNFRNRQSYPAIGNDVRSGPAGFPTAPPNTPYLLTNGSPTTDSPYRRAFDFPPSSYNSPFVPNSTPNYGFPSPSPSAMPYDPNYPASPSRAPSYRPFDDQAYLAAAGSSANGSLYYHPYTGTQGSEASWRSRRR